VILQKHFKSRGIDIIFAAFCLSIIIYYYYYISTLEVPIWDGAAYLLNAREWISSTTLTESWRPPLVSWLIDGIWIFTGEDWTVIKSVQMIFTLISVCLLYLVLKRRKGPLFGFGVSVLTLTNAQLFFYTSQILTEGVSLFFLVLTLYFLEGKTKAHWLLAGISIGLTFASRYPILLQALILFVVESLLKKNVRLTLLSSIAATVTIILVVTLMFTKTGTFQMALVEDSHFGTTFSSFYIENSVYIWGYAVLLLPVAFLFKSTFQDKFNYVFIMWFIISLLSWSTNASNHQERFIIQFMPAAYYLVILAIENLIKFDRNNLIFLKSMNQTSKPDK